MPLPPYVPPPSPLLLMPNFNGNNWQVVPQRPPHPSLNTWNHLLASFLMKDRQEMFAALKNVTVKRRRPNPQKEQDEWLESASHTVVPYSSSFHVPR